ncbi:alpha/beta hydrolase [Sphingomonas sp. 22L2VL55-3]
MVDRARYTNLMIRLAFLALAAMSTPVVAQTPASPPAKLLTWHDLTKRPKPMPDATVDYGTDPMQKVDVWLPKGKAKGPFPVVVMVHGGCWTTSIADRSLMNWIADDLRNAGVAVWNIDYRGVDRSGGGYPGTFADAAKAADQLKVSAKTFNLDTRHVLAIGHSAGGHLALWLAARAKLPTTSPSTPLTHSASATSSASAACPISKPPRATPTMAAAPKSSRNWSARPRRSIRTSTQTRLSRASCHSA